MGSFAMTKGDRPRSFNSPQDLVGEELASVCFVRDYVELRFDGPIIRSFLGPIVELKDWQVRFPEKGSRDALCLLIGSEIAEVLESLAELSLRLDGGQIIRVPLQVEGSHEAAHFVPMVEGELQVGRMLIW